MNDSATQPDPPTSSWETEGIALYVHVPFCQTKCPYCDFNTYAGIEALMERYVRALVHEIDQWGLALGRPRVNTIFWGGGTPSYLPHQHIGRTLQAIHQGFTVAPEAEVTLEANPGDLTPERLTALGVCGINRLSIGVQALDDGLLTLLGRRHTAQEAVVAYRRARAAGFKNVSLDLMYGLPYQTMARWQDSLRKAVDLSPEHLSLYCLTPEQGTPLERQLRMGHLPEPDPDLAAEQFTLAERILAEADYTHYEISNWARDGHRSRHNLTYWLNHPYLGVGPGAHSYLAGHRFANLCSPRAYIRRVLEWRATKKQRLDARRLAALGAVEWVEEIDRPMEMGETMMLGLRLEQGVAEADFRRRFGLGLTDAYGPQIHELARLGLLEWRDGALALTPRGRLLGNEVFQRFLKLP